MLPSGSFISRQGSDAAERRTSRSGVPISRRASIADVPSDPLQAELQEKCMQLLATQRNYEGLSKVVQLKQQELQNVRTLKV